MDDNVFKSFKYNAIKKLLRNAETDGTNGILITHHSPNHYSISAIFGDHLKCH